MQAHPNPTAKTDSDADAGNALVVRRGGAQRIPEVEVALDRLASALQLLEVDWSAVPIAAQDGDVGPPARHGSLATIARKLQNRKRESVVHAGSRVMTRTLTCDARPASSTAETT